MGLMIHVSGGHSSFHGSGKRDHVQSESGGREWNKSHSAYWRRAHSGAVMKLGSHSGNTGLSCPVSGVSMLDKEQALLAFVEGET